MSIYGFISTETERESKAMNKNGKKGQTRIDAKTMRCTLFEVKLVLARRRVRLLVYI